jgi:hypothetical protein
MCLSRKVVDFLDQSNERDFRAGRASYETYVRFSDIVERCRSCELYDNGRHGDMQGECRLHVLRVFVSMKRDVAQSYLERELARGNEPLDEGEGEGEGEGSPSSADEPDESSG